MEYYVKHCRRSTRVKVPACGAPPPFHLHQPKAVLRRRVRGLRMRVGGASVGSVGGAGGVRSLSVPEGTAALERGIVDGTILPHEALQTPVTRHHVSAHAHDVTVPGDEPREVQCTARGLKRSRRTRRVGAVAARVGQGRGAGHRSRQESRQHHLQAHRRAACAVAGKGEARRGGLAQVDRGEGSAGAPGAGGPARPDQAIRSVRSAQRNRC